MDIENDGQLARRPIMALARWSEPLEPPAAPASDIYETSDAFVLSLEMPGAVKDSLSVTVRAGTLTVKGEVAPHHRADATLVFREIGRRRYFREFNLGQGLDRDNIQAQFGNGVLAVTIPKTDAMKLRTIHIK
jgi:HSP20 family protein